MINIHRVVLSTEVEGPGKRFCIWFQGCSHHCDGCYAKDTWSFEENILMSVSEILKQIDDTPNIEGVTILGGEPFDQAIELCRLVEEIRKHNLSIIVFTGYTYEELVSSENIHWNNVLKSIDVLIDGLYEKENRSFSVPLIGSSNQKYYFLTERYSMGDFKENKIEVRISKDGTLSFNGMGDFLKLQEIMRGEVDGI